MARRIGIVLSALSLLLIAAFVVFVARFDANRYRGDLAARAKQWTGRALTIEGDLDLAFLPLRIVLHEVSFENAPGASHPRMASIERLDLGVGLAALVFERRLVIDHLRLSGVDVLLEQDSNGRGNWELTPREPTTRDPRDAPAPAPDPGGEAVGPDEPHAAGKREPDGTAQVVAREANDPMHAPAALPDLHELRLERVAVHWRDAGSEQDAGSGQETTFWIDDLTLEPRDGGLALDLQARFRDASIRIGGALGSFDAIDGREGPWPLRLSGDVEGTTFELDGTMAQPLRGDGVALRFAAKGPNLATLSQLAGVALPATRPWSFDARITQPAPDRYALDELLLVAGASRVSGSAVLERAARPRIEATLTSPFLDLDDFTTAETPVAKSASDASDLAASSTHASGSGGSRGEGGRLVPDVAIPFDALGSADAAIAFTLAKLTLAGLPFDDVAGRLGITGGALDLTLERAGLLGGRWTGAVDLGPRERTTRMRLRGDALPLGRLLEVTGVSTSLREGASTLDLELAGSGATTHALLSSLSGRVRADVTEGRLSGGVFDLLPHELRALLKPLLAGDGETQLRCAVTRFDVKGGIARSRVLAIDATRFTVAGAGSVDLGRESVSIDLEPRARDASLAGVVVPLRIRGSLAAPSVKADAARAIGSIAGPEIVARLREKTGFDLSQLGRALSGNETGGGESMRELSCEEARAIAAGRAAPSAGPASSTVAPAKRPPGTDPAPNEKPIDRLRDGLRDFFGR